MAAHLVISTLLENGYLVVSSIGADRRRALMNVHVADADGTGGRQILCSDVSGILGNRKRQHVP